MNDKTTEKPEKPAKDGPVVKEAIRYRKRLYAPGDRLPADTEAGVLARQRELGNI